MVLCSLEVLASCKMNTFYEMRLGSELFGKDIQKRSPLENSQVLEKISMSYRLGIKWGYQQPFRMCIQKKKLLG